MSKAVSKDSRERTLALLDIADPDDQIQRAFLDYHHDNPHVYKFLVHFAAKAVRELRKRGDENPQYSISAVVERVRWHVNFEAKGYPDFKIDNDYRARYARMIMRSVPKLRGVFNIRKLRTCEVPIGEIAKHAIAATSQPERANHGHEQARLI